MLRPLIPTEFREAFVEIHEAQKGGPRLVAAIEVPSPANKGAGSDGYLIYLRKRRANMLSGVHFVELDLLRNGSRMPMIDKWSDSPYVLMMARAGRSRCQVWRAYPEKPLPRLPIPLLSPDPDMEIDLQAMVDEVYLESRFSDALDYTRKLARPLSDSEQALLASRLKRPRT